VKVNSKRLLLEEHLQDELTKEPAERGLLIDGHNPPDEVSKVKRELPLVSLVAEEHFLDEPDHQTAHLHRVRQLGQRGTAAAQQVHSALPDRRARGVTAEPGLAVLELGDTGEDLEQVQQQDVGAGVGIRLAEEFKH